MIDNDNIVKKFWDIAVKTSNGVPLSDDERDLLGEIAMFNPKADMLIAKDKENRSKNGDTNAV